MIKIDTSYDNILKVNYDLFKVKLSELRVLAKSWYKGVDFKQFDNRFIRERDTVDLTEMKKSGTTCNLFFAYIENDKYYLIDGFNRLFTEYGPLEEDTTVYIKVITDKLTDPQLMVVMYRLNMWKLYETSYGGFKVNDFFDRGFRLLLKSKFDIELYSSENGKRKRYNNDLSMIDKYFVNEHEMSDAFKTTYEGVNILLSQENIINDIKSIIKGNDYLTQPFDNYSLFLKGYAMYLANQRYKGITKQYDFDYFLNKLYENKAFYKKLIGMSGNDSTRKNVYNFYRNLNLDKSK